MSNDLRQAGFTLLELLVALVVFAIMSAIAYGGLNQIFNVRQRLDIETGKWRELTLVLGRFEEDISQAVDRDYRDSFGVTQKGFSGTPKPANQDEPQFQLVRMVMGEDGGLTHLGYRLKNERLELMIWAALDQPQRDQPQVHLMLDKVKSLEFAYLGGSGEWGGNWPPLGSQAGTQVLPRAVKVSITLASGERISRVVALP